MDSSLSEPAVQPVHLELGHKAYQAQPQYLGDPACSFMRCNPADGLEQRPDEYLCDHAGDVKLEQEANDMVRISGLSQSRQGSRQG
ncbi:hypothetical protein Efla_006807 [Eimeria flavescens]